MLVLREPAHQVLVVTVAEEGAPDLGRVGDGEVEVHEWRVAPVHAHVRFGDDEPAEDLLVDHALPGPDLVLEDEVSGHGRFELDHAHRRPELPRRVEDGAVLGERRHGRARDGVHGDGVLGLGAAHDHVRVCR